MRLIKLSTAVVAAALMVAGGTAAAKASSQSDWKKVKVHFTPTDVVVSDAGSACDTANQCVFLASVRGTQTGDLQGSTVQSLTTGFNGTNVLPQSMLGTFTGNVTGCGAGGFLYRGAATVSATTLQYKATYTIVPGTGTGGSGRHHRLPHAARFADRHDAGADQRRGALPFGALRTTAPGRGSPGPVRVPAPATSITAPASHMAPNLYRFGAIWPRRARWTEVAVVVVAWGGRGATVEASATPSWHRVEAPTARSAASACGAPNDCSDHQEVLSWATHIPGGTSTRAFRCRSRRGTSGTTPTTSTACSTRCRRASAAGPCPPGGGRG